MTFAAPAHPLPALDMKTDLLRIEAYPLHARRSGSGAVECRETHISWVFLLDRDVFKVKKPVNLGFLDFGSIEARRGACEAEVTLNRRLAPRVYLCVVPIRRGPDGRAHVEGTGPIVDWAVHMKRLSDGARADVLLGEGALTPGHIDALAERIAAFHAACAASPEAAEFGAPSAVANNVLENFAQTAGALDDVVGAETADALRTWQLGFVRDHEGAFTARVASGRVRDGHGDLRLEHVYFEGDSVTVLDCIEFADRFRYADVCADAAFLSMDLAGRGRVDLAERFLAAYARASDDFDLYALVDFYESYRAFVRGKIATIVARDSSADALARARTRDDARAYFLLAASAPRRALLRPSLVAVGGLIGTGKSTLADAIGPELSAPVVCADRTRKAMLGAEAHQNVGGASWAGAYDPAFTVRVYDEMLRRASVVLASGRSVVLDASFRSVDMRGRARALALAHGVPFRFVECRAPDDVCRARLREREGRATVSDGRAELFDDFRARFEPVSELSASEHIVVDTSRPLPECVDALRSVLDTWPRGFGG